MNDSESQSDYKAQQTTERTKLILFRSSSLRRCFSLQPLLRMSLAISNSVNITSHALLYDLHSVYTREIITMLELGNIQNKKGVVAVDSVNCKTPSDGSFARYGGPNVPEMSYLDDYVSSRTLSKTDTLNLLHGVASSLSALHAAGVTHLEVKTPEFIVDTRYNPPRVSVQDFNNAAWADYGENVRFRVVTSWGRVSNTVFYSFRRSL